MSRRSSAASKVRARGRSSIANREAIDAGWIRLTYAEMEEQILSIARKLKALGVRGGDTVAILSPNSLDSVLLVRAISRIGATLLPLNTRLTPKEISVQVSQAKASVLLHAEGFTIPDLPLLALTPDDLRAVPESRGALPRSIDADRPYAVVFTSGTTGRAKGVILSRANALASAEASASALSLGPDDRWLLCLPLFHVGGLGIVTRCALRGACVVLHERFDPAAVNDAIDRGRVSLISVVSVMLRRMIEGRSGRPFPSTLRGIVVGGGPVEPDLIDSCPQALATYGLTETCSMVTLVRPDAGADERASAGPPLPGIEIRIVDGKGAVVGAGREGWIEVRGPVVPPGAMGERPRRKSAWFRTGDLGRMDAAGRLHVAGRREDLIISGGENIYPAEIEATLLQHPDVADAAVIGVADAEWGQVPLALVVFRSPGAVADEVVRFLSARLARFKIPRIVAVAEIPRLANGKPDRAAIAARYAG